MQSNKYEVDSRGIASIISWLTDEEIAIPEIQRPFVWSNSKVRDFIDSLYHGYPVGYIISCKNPKLKLKNGQTSEGKRIIIDGQQRIISLCTAILGHEIVDAKYKKIKIVISFNPITEAFKVHNPAIKKDKSWIDDISNIVNGDLFASVDEYNQLNPNCDKKKIRESMQNLQSITNRKIGVIELSSELDIQTVTEIFIRINSKGVVLGQADFAMSKIAADTEHNGPELRKTIDYFCRLIASPKSLDIIKNDSEFTKSGSFNEIKWAATANEDLYKADYSDLLRVAFTSKFERGRLSDLVSLLSGRNFESRTYEKEVVSASYQKLKSGISSSINQTNFQRFVMILKSAGFISPKLIRAKNAINFSYILYLKLKETGTNPANIEHHVRRWFVFSILTGRHSGSYESKFDQDIKQIAKMPINEYMKENEESDLSPAFWKTTLPRKLNTYTKSNSLLVFLASQIKENDKGFLSKSILVRDLISHRGDMHHLFPKNYLSKNGLTKNNYNQVANQVYMQSDINIKIGNKPPKEYMNMILDGDNISGISSEKELADNMAMHCIPQEFKDMDFNDYESFLAKRRKLISQKIKDYYFSL